MIIIKLRVCSENRTLEAKQKSNQAINRIQKNTIWELRRQLIHLFQKSTNRKINETVGDIKHYLLSQPTKHIIVQDCEPEKRISNNEPLLISLFELALSQSDINPKKNSFKT
jgi:hypothetical protein